jgi:uncharacterized phage protein gp47/JayE
MSDLGLSRVELTPDDRDPQATFDAMLATVQAALPTWDARDGALETVLLEAFATGAADVIYALNRLPGRIEQDILALYDVARYAGARATGTAVITWDTSRTETVAAGLRFAVPDTDIELEVTTTTSGTGATLSVPVRATEPGSAPNSVASAAALDVLDAIPYAVSVALSGTLSGGADPETDAAYIDRASTRLARVTSSLVVPEHFVAYALENPAVKRAKSYDLWDGTGSLSTSDTGYITIAMYGAQAQVASGTRTTIETEMAERAASMITPVVIGATLTTVNVAATVVALAGYDNNDVRDACEAAVRAYINTDTWVWDASVIDTEIISVLDDVPGVDYVTSGSVTPSGTTTITTPAGLATAGTVTITVT